MIRRAMTGSGMLLLLTVALAHGQAATPAQPRAAKPATATPAPAKPSPRRTATAGHVPRTPWGDPDLQGVWDYWTFTPLERPKEYANKPMLSDEEHKALLNKLNGQAATTDTRIAAQGDLGTYSQEVWTERTRETALKQTSLLIQPEDGKIPPMTPEAKAREAAEKAAGGHPVRMRSDGVASDNPEDRGLSERCLVGFSTGPPFQPGGYNNNFQIVQTPTYVAIMQEMIHEARIIPLDNRPRLPERIGLWLGDSRGRWEGDTLVVETTNYHPLSAFNSYYCCRSAAAHLKITERFRRVDANTIDYRFTVEDPSTFTRPFTVDVPMQKTDGPIFEYACHEANYGLEGILRGARADEKRAAGSTK